MCAEGDRCRWRHLASGKWRLPNGDIIRLRDAVPPAAGPLWLDPIESAVSAWASKFEPSGSKGERGKVREGRAREKPTRRQRRFAVYLAL